MQIEGDVLQKPSVPNRIAPKEYSQIALTAEIIRAIKQSSTDLVDEVIGGITVNNFDEVSASIHNQGTKSTKAIVSALHELGVSKAKSDQIVKELIKSLSSGLKEQLKAIQGLKTDTVAVSNLSDIPKTEEVRVSNLSEVKLDLDLSALVDRIATVIKVDVPQPVVNVASPNVSIDIPTGDIEQDFLLPILASLQKGLQNIRRNKPEAPLYVQMNDLGLLVEKLEEIREANRNVMLGFPGSIRVSNLSEIDINIPESVVVSGTVEISSGTIAVSSGTVSVSSGSITETAPTVIGDGSQTVTTSGTRVQLSTTTSIATKYVIITANEANTGRIWVGGVTVAAGRGRPLVALQSEKIDIDSLSKIYIDSTVSGEGVTFTYLSDEAIAPTGYVTDDDGNLISDDDGNPILGV